ncbi:2OG-Fe(II) oxygenase, partial [Paenibacillus dendritiformis]|uniref:2OG-Fe(II) oxygenase n=1 Tax=Paenibacillus dendritiformis TaxID=130049 RepID=UPI00345E9E8E
MCGGSGSAAADRPIRSGRRLFLERCREAGQTRPTPPLLEYETGGYKFLHPDMSGAG